MPPGHMETRKPSEKTNLTGGSSKSGDTGICPVLPVSPSMVLKLCTGFPAESFAECSRYSVPVSRSKPRPVPQSNRETGVSVCIEATSYR